MHPTIFVADHTLFRASPAQSGQFEIQQETPFGLRRVARVNPHELTDTSIPEPIRSHLRDDFDVRMFKRWIAGLVS